jgi:uncharacterized membrane protein YgcG
MATKRKTVKKSSKTKRNAKKHPKHFAKVYWPYIPIIAIVAFGMVFGGVLPNSRTGQPATLAYSTEMSRGALLSNTNAERIDEGLAALQINSLLNASAQAKAQDMVDKDYWSHNSPNGDAPWVFFDAAGYVYQKAGENLAYGFTTSAETVQGWMNSPSHRANILDSQYTEVGFGFVNSPNFVGTGQETVVVAHYGNPVGGSSGGGGGGGSSSGQSAGSSQSQPQSLQAIDELEPTPVVEELQVETIARADLPISTDNPVPEDRTSQNITRLQTLTRGDAPWSALLLSSITLGVVVIWLIKHAVLVKRFIRNSEHFVAHHPILDLIVLVIAAIAVYLSQASGVIL